MHSYTYIKAPLNVMKCPGHYTTHNSEENIFVQSTVDSGTIAFPSYFRQVSGTIKNHLNDRPELGTIDQPILLSISTEALNLLVSFIGILGVSARNPFGRIVQLKGSTPVYQVSENARTILVNPLIRGYAASKLSKIKIYGLKRLLIHANYLDIPSLINLFAFSIAKRLYLEDYELRIGDDQGLLFELLNRKLQQEETDPRVNLTDELIIHIAKYVYLRNSDVDELTVADYLGVNGQPEWKLLMCWVYHRGVNLWELSLSQKSLTSLLGLELICNYPTSQDAYTRLELQQNTILGSDLDLYFPKVPFLHFPRVRQIILNHNKIARLPDTFFRNLKALEIIDVSFNKLSVLSPSIFRGSDNLIRINVNGNNIGENAQSFRAFHQLRRDVYVDI